MSITTKISSLVRIALCLGVLVCGTTASRASKVVATAERENFSARAYSKSSQGAQAQKTVDQTGKNIQVLKGLPNRSFSS